MVRVPVLGNFDRERWGLTGTHLAREDCARRVSISGLQPSASSVAAGRRTPIGTRSERRPATPSWSKWIVAA
jgi:hypothetical protein